MKISRKEDSCSLCMKCVRDCASGVWRDVDGIPVPAAPELCNRCSHCLAVCPENAIDHVALDPSQVRRKKSSLIDRESYREIVLTRRSIRHYKKSAVPREMIEEIIDVARYSPTASNSQHVSYIVITDRERLSEISKLVFSIGRKLHDINSGRTGNILLKGLKMHHSIGSMMKKYIDSMPYYIDLYESGRDLILHHAPALILIHAPALSFFGPDNCNIAAANIMNHAHAMGLGTCCIGFVTLASRFNKKLVNLLEIPKGRKLQCAITLGHPAIDHPFSASRKTPEIKWI